MCNVCNIHLPQAMGNVISSIGIGTGCQHGIGLTLVLTNHVHNKQDKKAIAIETQTT